MVLSYLQNMSMWAIDYILKISETLILFLYSLLNLICVSFGASLYAYPAIWRAYDVKHIVIGHCGPNDEPDLPCKWGKKLPHKLLQMTNIYFVAKYMELQLGLLSACHNLYALIVCSQHLREENICQLLPESELVWKCYKQQSNCASFCMLNPKVHP